MKLRGTIMVGVCALWGTTFGLTYPPADLPAADPQATVEKLNLGPTKVYVHWIGQAKDFQFFHRKAAYYVAEEFAFLLQTEKHGTWQVISREPTPFLEYRFGTTFTGLKVDWKANPLVRVTGVKGVDRIPATFMDFKLDPDKTITALIVEVKVGDNWRPWFINNWLHPWGNAADTAMILSHYVGRPSPYFDVYGFRGDFLDLNDRSRQLVEKHPMWRAYHGRIVADPKAKNGWSLDLLHAFVRNAKTGGYDAVVGDTKDLIPLSRPSTALEKGK
jgi:hypothetical protein